MRKAHHSRHDVRGQLDGELDGADPGTDLYDCSIAYASRPRIVRVHQQGAAGRALHQAPAIVHPGVVGARVAAADKQQATVRRSGLEQAQAACKSLEVAKQRGGGELDPLARGQQSLRQCGLERPEVDAVRQAAQGRERQAAGPGFPARSARSETETEREAAAWGEPTFCQPLAKAAAALRVESAHAPHQFPEDLPVVPGGGRRPEQGR